MSCVVNDELYLQNYKLKLIQMHETRLFFVKEPRFKLHCLDVWISLVWHRIKHITYASNSSLKTYKNNKLCWLFTYHNVHSYIIHYTLTCFISEISAKLSSINAQRNGPTKRVRDVDRKIANAWACPTQSHAFAFAFTLNTPMRGKSSNNTRIHQRRCEQTKRT